MSAGFSGLEKLGQEVGQKLPWARGKGKMPTSNAFNIYNNKVL